MDEAVVCAHGPNSATHMDPVRGGGGIHGLSKDGRVDQACGCTCPVASVRRPERIPRHSSAMPFLYHDAFGGRSEVFWGEGGAKGGLSLNEVRYRAPHRPMFPSFIPSFDCFPLPPFVAFVSCICTIAQSFFEWCSPPPWKEEGKHRHPMDTVTLSSGKIMMPPLHRTDQGNKEK